MRNCLVIGGGGFIGCYVARLLVALGRTVGVLGRKRERPTTLAEECTYISGDYGDRDSLKKILVPGGEVINLAYSTVPKTSFEDPLFDLVSNLPTSVGLLKECLKAEVKKVLLISSGGTVYGSAHTLPITENHPTNPISPYGITKLAVDRYAMMFHKNYGLKVSIVRPSNAYGENQRIGTGQGFIASAIDAIFSGREVEIYGEHGSIRDYIHVSDIAEAIVAALDHGAIGTIYNVGTGIGTSNIEIIRILEKFAKEDGMEVKIKILPARKFDVEANILDASQLYDHSGWLPKISLEYGLRKIWNTAKNNEPLIFSQKCRIENVQLPVAQ